MNGLMRGMKQQVSRGWKIGWLLAGVMLLLGGDRVGAAPIVHRDWSGADRTTIAEWSRYLLGGPRVWSKVEHPPLTAAIEASIRKSLRTDPDGPDPMIGFLLWRLDIAPRRFAHYHPRLAPILTRISHTETAAQQVVPPSILPPTIQEENPSPPPVPEPGPWLLSLGMIGWAVWRARRRRAACGRLNGPRVPSSDRKAVPK